MIFIATIIECPSSNCEECEFFPRSLITDKLTVIRRAVKLLWMFAHTAARFAGRKQCDQQNHQPESEESAEVWRLDHIGHCMCSLGEGVGASIGIGFAKLFSLSIISGIKCNRTE